MASVADIDARGLPAKVAACRLDALESQAVFKVMLDTIARPGSIGRIPEPIAARCPSVLAPVLVLADVETRVHVVDTEAFVWEQAVTSATGAQRGGSTDADLVAIPADAVEEIASVLSSARRGTAESPESAARIVIGVHDLRSDGAGAGAGVNLVLTGPGVDGERMVRIDGLTELDIVSWKQANSGFPAGVDVWFTTDDGRTLGVPRSTHVDLVVTWPTLEGK